MERLTQLRGPLPDSAYPVSTGKLAGALYRDQSLYRTAQPWLMRAASARSAIGGLAIYGSGQTPTITVGVLTPASSPR